jgi:N-acetylglucosamine malate deacetylase 1
MLESLDGGILVIAPHPDDETLGAGGTLLRARALGIKTHWLIVTEMPRDAGWPEEKIEQRGKQIEAVREAIGFASVHCLGFPTAQLDTVPLGDLVGGIAKVVLATSPACVMLPHRGDAHSDHHVVWQAGAASTKWFRYPSVKWVLSYEALSETDAGLDDASPFWPQLFVDISETLSAKLKVCEIFRDEFGDFPFPRSLKALDALAALRGAAAGFQAAEAFLVHRARV